MARGVEQAGRSRTEPRQIALKIGSKTADTEQRALTGVKSRAKRRNGRTKSDGKWVIRVRIGKGEQVRWVTGDVCDFSEGGVGIALATPLQAADEVLVSGKLHEGDQRPETKRAAHVAWCLEKSDGTFRAGLYFPDGKDWGGGWSRAESPEPTDEEPDYYEVLQLSPNAQPDTIQRVYRLLAQRYHPDNTETGNEELFKELLTAYRTLNDAESRAAYDARHQSVRRRRWRLFERAADAQGLEAEKRKRAGTLRLLYTRRVEEPEQPGVTIQDLEDLLGCPRDHLQITLWYLKEKKYIQRDDRGRYWITVEGFEEAERTIQLGTNRRLLPAAG